MRTLYAHFTDPVRGSDKLYSLSKVTRPDHVLTQTLELVYFSTETHPGNQSTGMQHAIHSRDMD